MISRRNIRVKVMQTLYVLAAMEPGEQEVIKKTGSDILDDKLNRSLDLFTIAILYITRIAQYAQLDAQQRSSKYLPSEDDKHVSTKIAENELVQRIMGNSTFNAKVKDAHLEQYIDQEWVKKIYQQLIKTSQYRQYIAAEERNSAAEKELLQFIWEKQMLEHEDLQGFFNDELPGWEDDRDMIIMLMSNFFKSNSRVNFIDLISTEKREYAHALLHTVIDKEEYCMELINPKLKSWDTERVALIDLLLLRMGLCEFLYFPTIPAKVTINEFIEIAKMYSTPQSAQFVNGVLDNILKDLQKENKINKQERNGKS
ncbi:MAG: transcription antitermination factor NusB [Bacteroidetes bacterium 46-16]|nr:MAG: transcription antitermination factor NusB [Bacteroidetes bacterium 46-16]